MLNQIIGVDQLSHQQYNWMSLRWEAHAIIDNNANNFICLNVNEDAFHHLDDEKWISTLPWKSVTQTKLEISIIIKYENTNNERER